MLLRAERKMGRYCSQLGVHFSHEEPKHCLAQILFGENFTNLALQRVRLCFPSFVLLDVLLVKMISARVLLEYNVLLLLGNGRRCPTRRCQSESL